jgi:hypothetical protein
MTRRSYKEFAQPCPFAAAPPLRPPGPPGSAPDDAFRAGQIGRTAGSFDAAPHARCADTSAHPDHQRLAAHLAELGIVAAQGNAGSANCARSWRTNGRRGCPIDARASVIAQAAQLEALEVASKRSKSGSRCSIAQTRRASGWRPSRESGLSGRLRSRRWWRTDYLPVGPRRVQRSQAATPRDTLEAVRDDLI